MLDLSKLNDADRKELRKFSRFLRLMAAGHMKRMCLRPIWQAYMNVTPREGWIMAKAHRQQTK